MYDKPGRTLQRKCLMYRECQLLTDLYNRLHQYGLIAMVAAVGILAEISFSYVIVRNFDNIQVPILAFAGLCVIDSFVCLVAIFGVAAKVHSSSKKAKTAVSKTKYFRQEKWLRKFLQSCPTHRVCLLLNKFFDSLTPLKIQTFCIDNIVTLLLLK